MAQKKPKPRSGRRGDPVSLHPLHPDEAIRLMFKIDKKDVKEILASKPGKKKREGRP